MQIPHKNLFTIINCWECQMGMRRMLKTVRTFLWTELTTKGKLDITFEIWWKYSLFLYNLALEINRLTSAKNFHRQFCRELFCARFRLKLVQAGGPSIFVSWLIRVGSESVNDMTVTRETGV